MTPEGRSTQYLWSLVAKTIEVWFLGPGSLKIGYLDALGTMKCILVCLDEEAVEIVRDRVRVCA